MTLFAINPASTSRIHATLRLILLACATLLSPALAHSQQLTTVNITDPAYGITAFHVTIPAGYKFQSTVLPGPECSDISYPVFRAYSPDGLSEIRLMPMFNWTFHPNLHARARTPSGCLDIGHKMSAADFLKLYEEMVATKGMHVVGPIPVGALYQKRVEGVAYNMNHLSPSIEGSADAAAVRVETVNGSFIIEQRFRAYVDCRITKSGPLAGGGCSAHVDVLRAPKGKLDALIQIVDSHDLVKTPHEDAWVQRMQQTIALKNQQRMRQLTAQEQASAAMLKKQSDDFMAASQRNHEAFMAQQESSFHSSMNNANNAMNARSTASSDWVDYALDQQTVSGPGGIAKVSNAYDHTWSNTTGNQTTWYQTANPNANPNGVLPGNWVENTKVHGNGQAY